MIAHRINPWLENNPLSSLNALQFTKHSFDSQKKTGEIFKNILRPHTVDPNNSTKLMATTTGRARQRNRGNLRIKNESGAKCLCILMDEFLGKIHQRLPDYQVSTHVPVLKYQNDDDEEEED